MRNAPIGGGRSAAARSDDDVAFAGDGRQGDDAVEPKKTHAHTI